MNPRPYILATPFIPVIGASPKIWFKKVGCIFPGRSCKKRKLWRRALDTGSGHDELTDNKYSILA